MAETPTSVSGDTPHDAAAAVPAAARKPGRRLIPEPHRGQPHPLRRLSRFNRLLRVVGPGLITGAADDDPSGIGTYSQAGAAFGFGQLWLALYMLPLMIAVQEMCGRIGLVTNNGIAGVVRQHYGRRLLFGALLLLFVANTINVGADLGAMAAATQLLVPDAPYVALVASFAVGVLLLEVFVPYRYYARLLKLLVLFLAAYVLTGIIVGPDWLALLQSTLVPSIQLTPVFLALVVGVLGTTISPYLFFWQASEEVEEVTLHHRQPRGKDAKRQLRAMRFQLRALRVDTFLGMLASETVTWFILVTTAATLHAGGITNIATADQAASALEPLVQTFPHAGELTRALFAVGIVGLGLLAIPVLAGSAAYGIAEAFGWREGLARPLFQARGFYGVIAAATLVGMALNFLHVDPIRALVYAAVINGVVAVPLLALILRVANNRAIMGEHTNGFLSNAIGILTAIAMAGAAVAVIVALFVS
jgi:NRAMP (natural resistance-associated macrophage protein)-like metal ion transporter